MPGSIGSASLCSRRSSPDAGPRFNPFLVLDEPHKEHFRSTSIIRVDNDKVFCPICLELKCSEDVGAMDSDGYNRYVCTLFDLLGLHGESEHLRKIILTILEVFLAKRIFVLQRDDQYHMILRVLYRVMKSDHYNNDEFVVLTKIMSGISIESLQPIPLKSAWEAWRCMLDYGQSISFGSIIDRNSEHIPAKLTEFLIGQAIIVRTFLRLINHVAKDVISDLVFTYSRQKQEPLKSKYYETCQTTCIRFMDQKLFRNCECFLLRESQSSPLELRAISEVFSALRECFINATRRNDDQFLDWLREKDMIKIAHRIFHRNASNEHRAGICNFMKTLVQYYLEKEYGSDDHLDAFLRGVDDVETVAGKMSISTDALVSSSEDSKLCLFYLLLNWVAIKLKSRYFVAGRVKRVLTGTSRYLDTIKSELMRSRFFMRVFAFVVATAIDSPSKQPTNDGVVRVFRIFREDWRQIQTNERLADFRLTYCHEPRVFEWTHSRGVFCNLLRCEGIEYLIDRGIAQNNTVGLLRILLDEPLRQYFCRHIKRSGKSLFEKILPLGANAIDAHIMNEFSNWLPALLQEMVLRLKSNLDPDKQMIITGKLFNIMAAINLLLSSNHNPGFDPHFQDQFILDFTHVLERTYSNANKSKLECDFLIESHEFIALIIEMQNPSFMKMLQYIDFTLLGYMYHILDNYQFGDRLGEAIAHVLIAYYYLDHPLEHRIEKTLCQMSSSGYEWMMSANAELHLLSLILVEKFYPLEPTTSASHLNLLDTAKVCLVTGFLHMLCVNPELVEDEVQRNKIVNILKYEDFKYHPLYPTLLERDPQLRLYIESEEVDPDEPPASPDLSFASADDFEEEQLSVTRILEQLNDDEGYRSASTISVPRNIYLSRVIEEVSSDYPGTQEWERRAFEQTQSMNIADTENAQTGES